MQGPWLPPQPVFPSLFFQGGRNEEGHDTTQHNDDQHLKLRTPLPRVVAYPIVICYSEIKHPQGREELGGLFGPVGGAGAHEREGIGKGGAARGNVGED